MSEPAPDLRADPDERAHLRPLPWMGGPYRRLVLVSHPRHLDGLAPGAPDRLIVASDWLLWRRCATRGDHVLHLDAGVLADAPRDVLRRDLFTLAEGWVLDQEGRDLTRFRGVSLGRMFTREVSLFLASLHQIRTALAWFCQTYRPEEIELRDLRTEWGLLDDEVKREAVAAAAAEIGARVIDRLDAPAPAEGAFPFIVDFRNRPPAEAARDGRTRLKDLVRAAYSRAIDVASTLNWRRHGRKPRVLVLATGLSIANLVRGYRPEIGHCPMLIAEREPKTPAFLRDCWRRGVFLAHRPSAPLDAADRAALAAIEAALEQAWRQPATFEQRALRRYLRRAVLDAGALVPMAATVKRTEALLRRRPARIVVTDLQNPGSRDFVELGARLGIPVDYQSHGMRVWQTDNEPLTATPAGPPLIARMLAWGEQQLDYLRHHPGSCPGVRVGYPALDSLRRTRPPAPSRGHALILPYTGETWGFVNVASCSYPNLLAVIAAVRRQGFAEVRVKIHPGSKVNVAYYAELLAGLDPPVELVHTMTGLGAHLDWADIVVGPVASGAFVETLAADLPYYPLLIEPSIVSPDLLRGVPCFRSAAELEAALAAGRPPGDRAALLNYLCSGDDIPDASFRFWQAMDEAAAG